jgi:hypothetical protein
MVLQESSATQAPYRTRGGEGARWMIVTRSGVARPTQSRLIGVSSLADLPSALGRLARLVAIADHLDPKTVGRLAAEHARTLVTFADVIVRRDSVPGTAAPALLGAAGELRAHASTLAEVQTATRAWRSNGRDDPRPALQMREVRRQIGRDRARLLGSLTDSDLRTVIASLHPALRLAHAVRHVVNRQLHSGTWKPPRSLSGRHASPDVLAAVRAASRSAARMAVWLPRSTPPTPRYRRSALNSAGRRPDDSGRTR